MKHTIKGFITFEPPRYGSKKPTVDFKTYDPRQFDSFRGAVVREHTFEVEVADDFDPRPGLIASLEAQKRKARAEFAARVKEIDDQIAGLLAIENTAGGAK